MSVGYSGSVPYDFDRSVPDFSTKTMVAEKTMGWRRVAMTIEDDDSDDGNNESEDIG